MNAKKLMIALSTSNTITPVFLDFVYSLAGTPPIIKPPTMASIAPRIGTNIPIKLSNPRMRPRFNCLSLCLLSEDILLLM